MKTAPTATRKRRPATSRPAPCPLCKKYSRPNEETLAAIREAEEIKADIVAGKRKPMTLEEFFAEIADLEFNSADDAIAYLHSILRQAGLR